MNTTIRLAFVGAGQDRLLQHSINIFKNEFLEAGANIFIGVTKL
jgi:hypothetical protein